MPIALMVSGAALLLVLSLATSASWRVLAFVVSLAVLVLFVAGAVLFSPRVRDAVLGRGPEQRSASYLKITGGTVAILTALIAVFGALRTIEISSGDNDEELLNTRFQQAAESLGHSEASVRSAGILALAALADEWLGAGGPVPASKQEAQAQLAIDTIVTYLRTPIPLADGTVPPRPIRNPSGYYPDTEGTKTEDSPQTSEDETNEVTSAERDEWRAEALTEWQASWPGSESSWKAWAAKWDGTVPDWMEQWEIEPDSTRPGQLRMRHLYSPSQLDQGERSVRDTAANVLRDRLTGLCIRDAGAGNHLVVVENGSWSPSVRSLARAYFSDLLLSSPGEDTPESPTAVQASKAEFTCATLGDEDPQTGRSGAFSLAEILVYGEADLSNAIFNGYAWFDSATFNGHAGFDSATFNGDTGFTSATFNGDARFDSATFNGYAGFHSATFNGDAHWGYQPGETPEIYPVTWGDYTDGDGVEHTNRTTVGELGRALMESGTSYAPSLAADKTLFISPSCSPANTTDEPLAFPDLLEKCETP
ncbi:MAG: hypothetical protein LBT54_07090 [Bifidobacteriaceae bacterium]|nr:hypothetical protein [Bifidobacteriaceae bacterium]